MSASAAASSATVSRNDWWVGAHTNSSGGDMSAVFGRAARKGARAVALFVRNGRSWAAPRPIGPDEAARFASARRGAGVEATAVAAHGSYLSNFCSGDESTREKSVACLSDELRRCCILGIPYIVVHPGSDTKSIGDSAACNKISAAINEAIAKTADVVVASSSSTKVPETNTTAPSNTTTASSHSTPPSPQPVAPVITTILLENSAGQGHSVGSRFGQLHLMINGVTDKSRVGMCLDTCHAFAAGFDIRSKEGYEEMMQAIDNEIGLQYLKAVHINDCATKCGSKSDRHANIGKGMMGLVPFWCIMNDPRMRHLPLILETPPPKKSGSTTPVDAAYRAEIDLLYSLHSSKCPEPISEEQTRANAKAKAATKSARGKKKKPTTKPKTSKTATTKKHTVKRKHPKSSSESSSESSDEESSSSSESSEHSSGDESSSSSSDAEKPKATTTKKVRRAH
ncbi:deoxyribonuclease IV [Pelomyxa schiedti]|nr:deoxyribonuclease IV [Pelomyxa schiedti]